MFESILVSLVPISLVFELCALALSFYLKDSRIFFIVLSMLCARLTYLLAPARRDCFCSDFGICFV